MDSNPKKPIYMAKTHIKRKEVTGSKYTIDQASSLVEESTIIL